MREVDAARGGLRRLGEADVYLKLSSCRRPLKVGAFESCCSSMVIAL